MPEPHMVDVTVVETRIVPIPEPSWCTDPHDGANHFTAEAIPGVAARLREAAGLLDEVAAEAMRLREEHR
nr:hypothetical protein OG999_29410 [Streptomyces sp. NBC_00886]